MRVCRRVCASTPWLASTRIDRQVGEAGAHGHVARVFLVAGRVGTDEAAIVRGEVAVRHVDGDALLALRRQSVQQQAVVYLAAAAARFRVQLQRTCLVGVYELRVVQQMPDERRLAVVHGPARNEFQ